MRRISALTIFLASLFFTAVALAGDAAPELSTAMGTVEKAEKEALTFQSRGPGGKFGKKVVLKVTGTSKVTLVTLEKRAGKLVPVQRDIEAKDLETGQHIALIYTSGTDPVLLSAVVHNAPAKK